MWRVTGIDRFKLNNPMKSWDVFISHASEDKESFVRPLAIALCNLGLSVWYDEFSLRLGDSLSRSIDKGLAESTFGIVVISPHFLKKPWPEYELRGLVSREIDEDRVILPIWHGVSRKDVVSFSPPLADKVALNTEALSAEDIAIQILKAVRPDLYSKHPRAELERLASGAALEELQEEINHTRQELETAREELSEYRCPFCNAPLIIRFDAPADPEQKYWALREEFDCGYQTVDGFLERPCPSDPSFPAFTDYELKFFNRPEEPHWKWNCYAMGKTKMAKKLQLSISRGRTQEEAELNVREQYERYAHKSMPKNQGSEDA